MNRVLVWCAAACLLAAGCSGSSENKAGASGRPGEGGGGSIAPVGKLTPVPVASGIVTLSPENTSIRFRGTKVNGAHVGGFEKFAGKLHVNEETNALEGIEVEIDTASLWSDTRKLTGHLKNADFFNVKEYPKATFQSMAVEPTEMAGEYIVLGDLTLHGVTKEIRFPATFEVTDKGVTLTSQFKFDRTKFGMNYRPDQVHKEVSVSVAVGQKTRAGAPAQGVKASE